MDDITKEDSVPTIVAAVAARLEVKNAARERALTDSRQIIRHAANTIRAIHRNDGEQAARLLREGQARLAELAGRQRQVEECPLFLVWLADLSRLRTLGSERGRATDGLDCLESLLGAVIDAALAAQNAVVALESLGYGTVYIGGMRNKPKEVAATLDLPADVVAVFGLCVGRPDMLFLRGFVSAQAEQGR